MRVLAGPHPHQRLAKLVFFILTILVSMQWCLVVVLICIFILSNDIEHFLMCLLAVCVKDFFQSSCAFFQELYSEHSSIHHSGSTINSSPCLFYLVCTRVLVSPSSHQSVLPFFFTCFKINCRHLYLSP